MMEGHGALEEQLAAIGLKSHEVAGFAPSLKNIEELGAMLEDHLILDNRYTEHSTVGLAQQWDQLNQVTPFLFINLRILVAQRK